MLQKLIITLIISLFPFCVFAQQTTFKGVIVDDETKSPLEGVTILVEKTGNVVAVTTHDGRFQFVDEGNKKSIQTIVHFLGFNEKKVTLYANKMNEVEIDPSLEELEQVEIHEHGHDELSLSGMNLMSVNSFMLETQKATTISETLAKTPGVSYISTGVGISKPTVRGMAGSRVVVSVDGVKLEDQQWGMDHGLSVGQSTVDEVEIAKGAATLKYGSDGLGGVIRMKSPEPLGENSIEGKAGITYRSNNQYVGADFKVNAQKERVFYQLSGGYEDFGNYRVPAETFDYLGGIYRIDNGVLVNTGGDIGNLKATVGLETNNWISSISYSMFKESVGLFPGATGIPSQSWLDSFGNERNPSVPKQEILHQMITWNSHLDIGNGVLWFDLGQQFNNRQELSDPIRHGRPESEYGSVANELNLRTSSVNVHYDVEKENLKWETGINYEYQENERSGYDFLIPNYRQNTAGGYGMIGWEMSEKLELIGGLRFDYISFDSDEYVDNYFDDPSNSGTPWVRAQAISNDYYNFTGSVGLKWKLLKVIDANTNFAKTFRAPTANELAANGVHHGTFRHEQGTADLSPETGYQWDLNLSYSTKKVALSINPYFNYYSNYIYLAASGTPSTLPDGGQIYKYTESEGFFTGYEFSLNWNISKKFVFTNSVEYVYSVNTETKRSFPFVPPLATLNELTFTQPVKSSFFSKPYISVNAELVQAQNRVDRNELATDGYAVMGLKMGTGFHMKSVYGNLTFRVDNLTNANYMRHLSRYRILNLPEPGRNFTVSLSSWF
ncbi:TonB-dependent receptor [Flammeovirga pectinis]|uniref:TonB-dependent receptor n=1 Tax=Flammeovirga pectinis TaxID=2494373 RepID=A0A3S9P118_9BACT|nr:TonB-dependent receptor [Flammeovirga pectinis]AZQ61865.1 TonB-dependent receptor [Flammeovirga pectinis]